MENRVDQRDPFVVIRIIFTRRDSQRLLTTWQTKVFELFVATGKIDQETVDQMLSWPHSGFSVDNSVYVPPHDREGLERLAQYIFAARSAWPAWSGPRRTDR